ncbi:CidA/LrgA family protein [Pragia fontium]|uniref:UPF0299 membrane protein SAMN02745723_10826 n=2 Tax=Pragia fontium TaxID=82985 RepID=A0AAJ5BHU5_9GAMM|nr:CidA/LrgA family protein [Pragia fontium]AKJ42532.1 hypothetical protein QQ39_10910 [Pragia fontium]SFD11044.1 holin-like protein [Pragia fontium DSM 5563 = ATCC 49100]SUB82854.1 Putative effector of murein hydrolase LrgA [Pragia fontium]VEJ55754.1 Putative effector of murein hydrolase LrgA [Pragia fontium]GKX62640.1 UPF0299 membrane protein [Pragia fontium]
MLPFLRLCWQYLRAFILIYLCLLAGNAIAAILPLKIPGSIIGMLVLFALLCSQLLPVAWIKPGCYLFIRHMALLFVPISVGIMKYYQSLVNQFGPLAISCLVSSLVTMLIVGYSSHYIHGIKRLKPDSDKEPL